jgi:hypothetical protein
MQIAICIKPEERELIKEAAKLKGALCPTLLGWWSWIKLHLMRKHQI